MDFLLGRPIQRLLIATNISTFDLTTTFFTFYFIKMLADTFVLLDSCLRAAVGLAVITALDIREQQNAKEHL